MGCMREHPGAPDPLEAKIRKLRQKLAREARLAHADLSRVSTLPLDGLDVSRHPAKDTLTISTARRTVTCLMLSRFQPHGL